MSFLTVSRPTSRCRVRYDYGQPRDSFEAICRRLVGERMPFQYGIVSLLAAMVAVALVCAAIVYPFKAK